MEKWKSNGGKGPEYDIWFDDYFFEGNTDAVQFYWDNNDDYYAAREELLNGGTPYVNYYYGNDILGSRVRLQYSAYRQKFGICVENLWPGDWKKCDPYPMYVDRVNDQYATGIVNTGSKAGQVTQKSSPSTSEDSHDSASNEPPAKIIKDIVKAKKEGNTQKANQLQGNMTPEVKWKYEKYEGIFMTLVPEMVPVISREEAIIADCMWHWLGKYSDKLTLKYEKELAVSSKPFHPDYYVKLNGKIKPEHEENDRDVQIDSYWEHLGVWDKPEYRTYYLNEKLPMYLNYCDKKDIPRLTFPVKDGKKIWEDLEVKSFIDVTKDENSLIEFLESDPVDIYKVIFEYYKERGEITEEAQEKYLSGFKR